MSITLIQLISEQTIQNLLPILRIRPNKLVHLVTPKTAARSDLVRVAAHAAGLDPEIEVIPLSTMPGIPECFPAVRDAFAQVDESKHQVVVNFTGGTKLMSIGAYAAAQVEKVPSLYVDTQDNCFVDGATSPEMAAILGGDWSFTPIRNQLRVDVLGIANGVERVTGGKDWEMMLPLAKQLFTVPADEETAFLAIQGPEGLFPYGKEPRTPADWLAILDRPFCLPGTVADLAQQACLLRRDDSSGACRLPDATRSELKQLAKQQVADFKSRFYRAVAPLQHATAFLSGAWWEVIVCDAAHRSGLFRDLRWSAQVGERDGADTEEDVLALDGAELLYVNCKRGGSKARLLPLLEELRARASTIGGSHNRRFLAVLLPLQGRTAANLQERAKALGIRVITRENVYRPEVFAHIAVRR